jgi:predicted nuclease with TOPRIM domain
MDSDMTQASTIVTAMDDDNDGLRSALEAERFKYTCLEEEFSLLQTQLNDNVEELKILSEEKSLLSAELLKERSKYHDCQATTEKKMQAYEAQVYYLPYDVNSSSNECSDIDI